MAGHSKFKNIMYRKGAQDAKRAKIFTKLGREIIVATKAAGPDPNMNPRLRQAIAAARAENMPKDKIENAVKRGSGSADGDNYEEVRYEGFGPGGVAVIVEGLTDNRNRTVAEVRSIFNKNGGNMGDSGSVSFMFDQVGCITYPLEKAGEDEMFEAAVEAGADNVESGDEVHEIYCAADDLSTVRDTLAETLGDPDSAKLVWNPKSTTPVDESAAETLLKLIDALEDNDDVQNVYANYEIDDAILEKLSA